ncbi:MAG: hypothetical protein ABIA47_00520 [bacterium]
MIGVFIALPAAIEQYLATTPVEVMGAHILLAIGWVPIFAVAIWGFSEVWLFRKQVQYWEKFKWTLYEISVPQDAIQTPMGMANFFTNLAGSKSSITWKEKWFWGKFQSYFAFEIVSNGGHIKFYIRTTDKYRDLLEASLYAQYPEAQMLEVEDYVDLIPNDYPHEEYDCFGTEMMLKKPQYVPIKTWDLFEHQGEKDQRFKDPLLGVIEILGKMRPGEHFWIQLLVMQPDSQGWIKEGEKFVNSKFGKEELKKKSFLAEAVGWVPQELLSQAIGMGAASAEEKSADNWAMFRITPDEKELIDSVSRKTGSIGWLTKIRVVYCGKKDVFRKGTAASMIKGIFHQYGHLGMNKFGLHIPSTPKDDYFYMLWQMPMKQRRLIKRYKNRSFGAGATPYILNCEELATLFHFPAADARTPVLTSIGARRAEAPSELEFAGADDPTLPNLDRVSPDVQAAAGVTVHKKLPEPKPLVVPTPSLGVEGGLTKDEGVISKSAEVESYDAGVNQIVEGEYMPKAGMPAPLPPGLDLADEPIGQESGPENLPI